MSDIETKELTAMNQLLVWLNEFDDMPIKPTYINMKEKVWQLLPIESDKLQQANKELDKAVNIIMEADNKIIELQSQLKAKDKEIENIKLEIISVLKPFIHDSISSDDIERIEKFTELLNKIEL